MTQMKKGNSVLVTGGTGLIGRQVTRLLAESGKTVTTVSLDEITVPWASHHFVGDLRDQAFCMEVTAGASEIYHLAGIKGSLEVTSSKPATFMVPMIQFNTNLLEAARKNRVEKLVFTSSIGAYSQAEEFFERDGYEGQPMDSYPGWAKRIAEIQIQAYAKEHGLNWSIVRPCNVYGPGDNFDPENAMVIPSLMTKILRGDDPVEIWGDGSAVRDFAYSEDIARGILLAGEFGTRGSFVNLSSGKPMSIKNLVDSLKSFLDFNAVFDRSKPAGHPKRVMNIDRATSWLGYQSKVEIEEGLKRTWDWLVSNPHEHKLKKNYFSEEDPK